MSTQTTTHLMPRATDAFVNFSRFEVKATLGNMLLALRHEYVRGPKTQLRRPVKMQPPVGSYRYDGLCLDNTGNHYLEALDEAGNPTEKYFRLSGFPAEKAGQRLFVREGWARCDKSEHSPNGFLYRADFKQRDWKEYGSYRRYLGPGEYQRLPASFKWQRSTQMPPEACRIVLEVVDVRAEPLQVITDDDAWAEGAWEWAGESDARMNKWCKYTKRIDPDAKVASVVGAFAAYWDTLHALPDFYNTNDLLAWKSNPWVSVTTYKRLLPENEAEVVTDAS